MGGLSCRPVVVSVSCLSVRKSIGEVSRRSALCRWVVNIKVLGLVRMINPCLYICFHQTCVFGNLVLLYIFHLLSLACFPSSPSWALMPSTNDRLVIVLQPMLSFSSHSSRAPDIILFVENADDNRWEKTFLTCSSCFSQPYSYSSALHLKQCHWGDNGAN